MRWTRKQIIWLLLAAFTIRGRTRTPTSAQSPGVGKYFPGYSPTLASSAKFTFGARTEQKPVEGCMSGPLAVPDTSVNFLSNFKRSPGYSISSRPATSERSRSPGPAAYNTQADLSSSATLPNAPKSAFSKSKRVTTLAAAAKRAQETPSPGQYSTDSAIGVTSSRPNSPSWTLRPRPKDIFRSRSPGPSYTPNSSCMSAPDLPSQQRTAFGKFDHRDFEARNLKNSSPGPGPGKYTPPSAFGGRSMFNSTGGSTIRGRHGRGSMDTSPVTPGPYMVDDRPLSRARRVGAAKFGAAPRKLTEARSDSPGPGAYGDAADGKQVGAGRRFSIGKAKRPSIAQRPATSAGPGSMVNFGDSAFSKKAPSASFGKAGRFKYPRSGSPAPGAYGPISSTFIHRPVYTM